MRNPLQRGAESKESTGPTGLALAPVGLGCLLTPRYVQDARLMYCPSTGGAMPTPRLRPDPSRAPSLSPPSAVAACRGHDMLRAGGWYGEQIMYGDWSWLGEYAPHVFRGRVVMSDYAYRGMPINIGWGHDLPARVRLLGTRPAVSAEVGCPAFKTQKLLGGRAIVADSFGRSFCGFVGAEDDAPPGNGFFAHRNGYNVLYADWSLKWHSDGKSRLAYWPAMKMGNDKTSGWYEAGLYGSGSNSTMLTWWKPLETDKRTGRDESTPEREPATAVNPNSNCGAGAWHLLDEAAGIDVIGD